jgi:nitrate reductase gamma subunit
MVAWRSLVVSAGSLIRHVADTAFLALLFVEVSSGLLTAVLYRWASSWAASTLAPYTRSLFDGEPAAALIKGLPFVVQIHVATAFLLLAVFPFTGIAALLTGTVGRRVTSLFGPVAAHVQSAGATLRQRYNPSAWVWPEEEE